jgi:hypothetical protein
MRNAGGGRQHAQPLVRAHPLQPRRPLPVIPAHVLIPDRDTPRRRPERAQHHRHPARLRDVPQHPARRRHPQPVMLLHQRVVPSHLIGAGKTDSQPAGIIPLISHPAVIPGPRRRRRHVPLPAPAHHHVLVVLGELRRDLGRVDELVRRGDTEISGILQVTPAAAQTLREQVLLLVRVLAPGQVRARRALLLTRPLLPVPALRLRLRRRPARKIIGPGRHPGIPRVPRQLPLQLRQPLRQVIDLRLQVRVPRLQVRVPRLQVRVPRLQVRVPRFEIRVPRLQDLDHHAREIRQRGEVFPGHGIGHACDPARPRAPPRREPPTAAET